MLDKLLQWLSPSADIKRNQRVSGMRWVVVDVETTGLDQSVHQILSIGAVALTDGKIQIGDSFEAYLRQPQASDKANILIHGISAEQQLAGLPPRQACERFLDFVAGCPLIGFQASFDRGFLARAVKTWAQAPLTSQWLDVAELARMTFPQAKAKALDEWLAFLKLDNEARHSAVFDALATARLTQMLLAQLPDEQREFSTLQKLAAQAKFLPRNF